MNWAYLFDAFHGRISRKTFWIAIGAVGIANLLACYLAAELGGNKLSAIVDLAFTYPEFAIAAKRGNDRNMPLWPLLVFFGGSAFLDLLDVQGWAGTADKPSALSIAVAVPFTIIFVVLIVELGFRRGTPGPNPHGPDPLANA
jgi:uncharacterized membrane protein YhaH (DUF805 family)